MKQNGQERRRPGLASNLSRFVVSVQTDLSRRVNINLADFIGLRMQIYGDLFMLLEPKGAAKIESAKQNRQNLTKEKHANANRQNPNRSGLERGAKRGVFERKFRPREGKFPAREGRERGLSAKCADI